MPTKQISDLSLAIASLTKAEDVQRFLDDLLSPSERQKIESRWQVAVELVRPENASKSQQELAKRIGCAPAIITRVKYRTLRDGTGVARRLAVEQITPRSRARKRT